MHFYLPCITPLLSVVVSLFGIVVGVLIGIFAEPIRGRIYRPVLIASFDEHDDGCRSLTPIGDATAPHSEGYYIRVKVNNRKRRLAKSCRAFLVAVEQRNARGEFQSMAPKYDDSLPLAWACQRDENKVGPLDLPSGISQFVDIVSTDKQRADFGVHAPFIPNRYRVLFDSKPKVLRFTVLVTGDDVVPGLVKVIFEWRGKWDDFEVAKG